MKSRLGRYSFLLQPSLDIFLLFHICSSFSLLPRHFFFLTFSISSRRGRWVGLGRRWTRGVGTGNGFYAQSEIYGGRYARAKIILISERKGGKVSQADWSCFGQGISNIIIIINARTKRHCWRYSLAALPTSRGIVHKCMYICTNTSIPRSILVYRVMRTCTHVKYLRQTWTYGSLICMLLYMYVCMRPRLYAWGLD